MSAMDGHVYILTSPNSQYVKIGGTGSAPMKRIKEINVCTPYRELGPWTLYDFRHVSNWRKVEYDVQYAFRAHLVKTVQMQKELFAISPRAASQQLVSSSSQSTIKQYKIDRMFQDAEFFEYVQKLFRLTGLLNWLDLQGAWTFNLFPATGNGRYFTMNIGRHEVAYATIPRADELPIHMIYMDRLIHDFKKVQSWISKRDGAFYNGTYPSALPRSTAVVFTGNFDTAMEFIALEGVRRAVVAYWTEALIGLQERGSASVHSRSHNWNAVATIKGRIADPGGT
ncbi:MAG: GIY-YIG nuclease family protein [Gammaproteobacteria bacterium]|nr:GIY-YIG nuclease family protein [Gammaproteobacteria bacterium]